MKIRVESKKKIRVWTPSDCPRRLCKILIFSEPKYIAKILYIHLICLNLQLHMYICMSKRAKMLEERNFLKKKCTVSLEKDFIFQSHIYYFLVSYTYSGTSAMVSFNNETLNSGANLPL